MAKSDRNEKIQRDKREHVDRGWTKGGNKEAKQTF